MQDRYVGDIGDFGKYGLLRILGGTGSEPRLKLGVAWYLYPDEAHNADGKHVAYLQRNDPLFRDCDPLLYDKLRALIFDNLGLIGDNRNLGAIERSEIWPEGTIFYNQPFSYSTGLSFAARFSTRVGWFAAALEKCASSDLVFLDPDNGIECASVTRTKNKGPKYVFWDDIDAFVKRGQSLVIYHHLGRNGTHHSQVEEMCRRMSERYRDNLQISAAIYKRGTGRAYFVIAAPQHGDLLSHRLKEMSTGFWNRHFDFTYIQKSR